MNIKAYIKAPPLFLNQEDATDYLGSVKLFSDMLACKWISPCVQKHKMNLYDRVQLDEAANRVRGGEYPEPRKRA